MAEAFDPFASGLATEVVAEPAFDPFASGQAVEAAPPAQQKEAEFDPFAAGRAEAITDTSMIDRLEGRLSPERQLPADSLQRIEAARIKAIEDAPEPTLLVRLKENIKSGWSNSTIGSLLESLGEPIANEPLELRRQRFRMDQVVREKARRAGQLGDVMSDPSVVEYTDKMLDSEIEKHGKKLAADVEKFAPVTEANIKQREKALTETAQRIGSYQGLPDYQGPVEGLASLTGQILGSVADPANLIGGPEVRLARNATRLGRVANQFVSQGVGGALGNLAVEPVSQANRIRTGELDQFSPADAAKGAALGFVAGGTLGAIPAAVSKKPSIVTQMDGATKGTPAEANAQANSIAMQPVGEVQTPPTTSDINGGGSGATLPPKVPEAPTGMSHAQVAKMTSDEFMAHYQQPQNSITNDAVEIGKAMTDNKEIEGILEQRNKLRKESEDLINAEKYDEAAAIGYKAQFFNEIYETATKTGGFVDGGVDLSAPAVVADFDKAWNQSGKEAGSENQIVFSGGRVFKRNYNEKLGEVLPNHRTIEAFRENLTLHNSIFPETEVKFEGMSKTKDGEAPIVSQAEVKGTEPTKAEIDAFMAAKGFEPYSKTAYINKELGVRVGDLKGDNVIKAADGTIHVIDPVIKKIEPEPSVSPREYLDEQLAANEITAEEHAARLAELGDTPAAKPITVAATKTPDLVLPQELSRSNPRYKTSEVRFEDPLDKALYIIASDAKRSARDADFLKLVMDHTGIDEAAAREAGRKVRDKIRVLSTNSKEGKTLNLKRAAAQKQSAPAPVKAAAQPAPAPAAPAPAPAAPVAQAGGGAGGVPPGQVPAPNPAFNNPIPNYGWTPFISKTSVGAWLKQKIGTIEGNIRKALPEAFGALRERGFKINELKFDWHNMSKGYGEIRKLLKPEAFTELDRLLQSGLHDDAAAFIRGSKYEPEITQYIADFKKTLDALRRAEINSGRQVGLLDNYWIRHVADYEGLRKALGRDPSNAVERAIKAAETQKKRGLTAEEERQVINDLISTSFSGQGKPGFLNPRTIGEIQKDWFKFYEPSDVAIEQRINRVATDVVDRAYFGKFEPAGLAHAQSGNVGAIEGSFGEIIQRALDNKTLSPEASREVVRNLQDFLRSESGFNEVQNKLAMYIRKGQTYGYLSDLSSAIPQFGDFFLTAWRNGFLDAEKGFNPFRERKVTLDDIKLHQGTPDTVIYSKRNREGFVGSVFRKAVQTSIGLADGFNKKGTLNASFKEAARDMNNVNSDTYKRLDSKWSERFPNRWPDIKRDLQSPAFARGQLNPNTQFFLYSELADIQPISGESFAQGYHQAGPMGKIAYGLRSFAIKQLDVMRESGYEKMRSKDPAVRAEGRKNLVTYALVVGIGQQFLSSYMRDVLFDRETNASEYGVSGLMSLVGLNRYFIYRSGDVGAGTAALEMLVPGVGIANDIGQSAGVALKGITGQRNKTTGMRTIPDVGTAVSKMNIVKYVPFIGRGLDRLFGPANAREAKKREEEAKGKPQKSTIQQIEERLIPPDVAR
jgi:hypothetical protein